jgi:alpha-ketoglutarate-dependent taurine dioxygenase
MQLTKLQWHEANAPQRLWAQLNEVGAVWFHIPGAAAMVEEDRHQFVAEILGQSPKTVAFREIKVDERAHTRTDRNGRPIVSYEQSSEEAHFHTDVGTENQRHLQIMVCKRQAEHGGASRFVDMWKMLDRALKEAPDFYAALFTLIRPIMTSTAQAKGGLLFSPTFAWRNGNLVCAHVPRACTCDYVGKRLLAWIREEEPYELHLQPDDCYVSNNLRMVHGRTAFDGSDRLLYRLNTDLHQPLSAPEIHLRNAIAASHALKNLRTAIVVE